MKYLVKKWINSNTKGIILYIHYLMSINAKIGNINYVNLSCQRFNHVSKITKIIKIRNHIISSLPQWIC